jgi:hypothetical protein
VGFKFGAFGFDRFVVDLDLVFTGFDDPVLPVFQQRLGVGELAVLTFVVAVAAVFILVICAARVDRVT